MVIHTTSSDIFISWSIWSQQILLVFFFLKEYLNLSASFIASIGFWAGIPWALKMPFGFLVDKFWNKKNYLVIVGAVIIFKSIFIMFLLITERESMEEYLSAEAWFIISAILTPIGYVIQDVVADAMTVEAVENKNNYYQKRISKRNEHMLLQLYGRFAIILGSLLVGLLNIFMFSGIDKLEKNEVYIAYSNIYFLALFIPLLSVSGVILSNIFKVKFKLKNISDKNNTLDFKIFMASIFFVFFAIIFGSMKFPFSQELVLIVSLILIFILMKFLVKPLSKERKYTIIGTALIVFF